MDSSDSSSKPSILLSLQSIKEFSLKDAKPITGIKPNNINLIPDEEKFFIVSEKNLKTKKSSHIQTGFSLFNNKLKVKIKSDTKSIDVLMNKAYDLRKSNEKFNTILKVFLKKLIRKNERRSVVKRVNCLMNP